MRPALFLALLYLLPAAASGPPAARHVALVVQHSGAHRASATAIIGILDRLVAAEPESTEFSIVGFAEKFETLDPQHYRRKTVWLLPRTADRDQVHETVTSLVFHGPSPIYDAVKLALHSEKPSVILLVSNGVDNASETEFEELLKEVEQASAPVVSLYFPSQPPAGGDSRLRKLAKVSGGKFIDVRSKDSWDQLVAALK